MSRTPRVKILTSTRLGRILRRASLTGPDNGVGSKTEQGPPAVGPGEPPARLPGPRRCSGTSRSVPPRRGAPCRLSRDVHTGCVISASDGGHTRTGRRTRSRIPTDEDLGSRHPHEAARPRRPRTHRTVLLRHVFVWLAEPGSAPRAAGPRRLRRAPDRSVAPHPPLTLTCGPTSRHPRLPALHSDRCS